MVQATSGGNVNPANLNFPGLNSRSTLLPTDFLIVARPGFQNVKVTVAEVNAGGGVPDPLLLNDGSAAAPTYSYSSEPGSGVFLFAPGDLRFSVAGVAKFKIITSMLTSIAGTGAALSTTTPSNTVPVLLPRANDPNTGIGSQALDKLSLIAGGIEALQLAEVSNHIIQTNENQVGLTASVTQTQAGGLQLLSSYNEIATVANTDDTVVAPSVAAGMRLLIINNGANRLQVFPFLGDDIGEGVNNPITIAAGIFAKFIGRTAVFWDNVTGSGSSDDYILIQDQKATGTDGGTFTSGAWRTRTLNTEVADTGNNATLSANQITLQPGTYRCRISAPGFEIDEHKLRLRNITDSVTTIVGTTEDAEAVAQTRAFIEGRFTIATAKAFEVQHFCTLTGSGDGFGNTSGSIDEIAIYCSATFWKEK